MNRSADGSDSPSRDESAAGFQVRAGIRRTDMRAVMAPGGVEAPWQFGTFPGTVYAPVYALPESSRLRIAAARRSFTMGVESESEHGVA